MNLTAILALIGDLYAQNDALQLQLAATVAERDELKAQLPDEPVRKERAART